uniref:Uncharacterized protein n=1 Tax=Rhizophora mucronata TaxID=61149 RepID=A0A2P2QQ00_RHIMU
MCFTLLHFSCHKIQELPILYRSITVSIKFADHVQQFFFCRVLAY